jgi:DNA-binding NarL/FixJ family response regulator
MIRTLIVDDQNIIRKGIKVLLENSAEIELVGFAENGETALAKIAATQPDVVLLDINLPGIDGIAVANQLAAKFPKIKVIMLSSYEDESYVKQAIESSAKGYLLKNISAEELEWSIKLVHQGYSAFKSELLTSLNPENKQINLKSTNSAKAHKVFPAEHNLASPKSSMASPKVDKKSAELELLLARNQVRQKYSAFKQQRQNSGIHDVTISRAKKTMMSFEFKLLIFIILFSLGFLVFVALSSLN